MDVKFDLQAGQNVFKVVIFSLGSKDLKMEIVPLVKFRNVD